MPAASTWAAPLAIPARPGSPRHRGDFIQRDGAILGVQLGNGLAIAAAPRCWKRHPAVTGVRGGYVTHAREELLSARKGSGTFDTLNASPGIFLKPAWPTAITVWLDITRLDVSQAAASFDSVTAATLSSDSDSRPH